MWAAYPFRLASLLLALPLLGLNCPREKDEPAPLTPLEQLPPATTEGKDTFGCLVNGQPWVLWQRMASFGEAGGDWSEPTMLIIQSNLTVQKNGAKFYQLLGLILVDSIAVGRHSFGPSGSDRATRVRLKTTVYDFSVDDILSGHLTITRLDRAARIVSGTFAFSMAHGADTVRVTNGRFDLSDIDL